MNKIGTFFRGEIRKEVTKEKAWLRVRRKGIPQHIVVLLVASEFLSLSLNLSRSVILTHS